MTILRDSLLTASQREPRRIIINPTPNGAARSESATSDGIQAGGAEGLPKLGLHVDYNIPFEPPRRGGKQGSIARALLAELKELNLEPGGSFVLQLKNKGRISTIGGVFRSAGWKYTSKIEQKYEDGSVRVRFWRMSDDFAGIRPRSVRS
jgi:hypothetical protein